MAACAINASPTPARATPAPRAINATALVSTCFALALSTFISQNIGAEKYDRVKAGMKFGLICSPVLAECIGILFYIFAPYLIGAFNSNPDVISFGVQQARTLSLFYCLLSYSHSCAVLDARLSR